MPDFGIVVFPGSNCDHDCFYMIENHFSRTCRYVWHKETDVSDVGCVVLPGGFSYGDYLRTGCIASFSPVIESIRRHAEKGKPVIGICNGFQILVESGMLPGAFLRNSSLTFVCKWTDIIVENTDTPFTGMMRKGEVLRIPVANGEGNYYLDKESLYTVKRNSQVVFRYCEPDGTVSVSSNPNGSADNIAGICNSRGNVLGIMPHPERSYDDLLGSSDGSRIFESVISWIDNTVSPAL